MTNNRERNIQNVCSLKNELLIVQIGSQTNKKGTYARVNIGSLNQTVI